MDYPTALAWLYGTQLTGIKLGLDSMRRLLAALGWQQPAGTRFLHVAGTNGKGSVCAMLAAICRAGGFRTGLYTSPHLVSFRERIRLGDAMIPEATVAAALTRLRELTEHWENLPTFFELTTALAFGWFARDRAEIVVLETGLGGRLDATNVVTPAVSVITSLDLDHTAWLGSTLAEIAGEKAGIFKPGVPAVSAPQPAEAALVLEQTAQRVGTPLQWPSLELPGKFSVNLAGSHQRANAALALAALRAADIAIPESSARAGLENVDWPGRFQRLEAGRIILDGAHNPAAARRLAQTWREEYGDSERASIILGLLRDKDAAGICESLAPIAARFIVTKVRTNPRASEPAEIAAVLAAGAASKVPCVVTPDLAAALAQGRAQPERILVTGSLFLVGEALAELTEGGSGTLPASSLQ
ncbi:MAG: bifunctional folylpolyglutamate synthase/dihydrofolate synthase [Verrucomicrobia bacterium]|nr:bifunctional folylpolyglutamate synthase/dihydrofolate synthase [Verrucomicrobiota bacterium]